MSKYLEVPIVVECQQGKPVTFGRGRDLFAVRRILDHWRETGRWWEGEGEKDFFLVEANPAGVRGQGLGVRSASGDGGGHYLLYRVIEVAADFPGRTGSSRVTQPKGCGYHLEGGRWFLYRVFD